MSVYEKLLAVQSELKAPKNQLNSFGNYNYRSCEDILEAVKPLLVKNKATLRISDNVIMIGERFYLQAMASFIDVETGESVECKAYANESGSHKGMTAEQITGTASSYARKYCLNGLFLIDDTKDADTDEYRNQQKCDKKEEALKQEEHKITSEHNNGNVRYIDGTQCQIKSSNGKWYNVEQLNTSQLESLAKNPAFSAAHEAMKAVLNTRGV